MSQNKPIPSVKTDSKITTKEAVQNTAGELSKKYQFMAIEELNRTLYFYNIETGLWQPAEINLRKMLEDSHKDYADEKFIQAVINKIRNNYPKKLREIPKPPNHLIPLKTAIWDLNENKPILYSEKYYFLHKANVDAIKENEFPTIKKFEKQLFGENEEKKNTYRKMLAYFLANGYPIKKAFIFYGPGDCGKSKAIELAEKIVGSENITNISLQDLLGNRFAKARLFNKKLNTFADLPPSIVINPGQFKVLTGGDNLGAEQKGKDGFDFKNEAKFLFSCNQIPEADPDEVDITFFYRWEFLDFENIIPKDLQDPEIIEKLLPELDGYCYELIQQLKPLLNAKKFSDKTPEDCQEIWMSHSVSAPQFVQECLENSPGNAIEATFLGEKYLEYCRAKKLPPQSISVLGKTIKANIREAFQGYSSRFVDDKHESFKVWRNIKLKEMPTMPTVFESSIVENSIMPTMPTLSKTLREKNVFSALREKNMGGIVGISPFPILSKDEDSKGT